MDKLVLLHYILCFFAFSFILSSLIGLLCSVKNNRNIERIMVIFAVLSFSFTFFTSLVIQLVHIC
jgi:hypothetical protein|uniref:Uncharacterized protein n=1 Tax=Myoviridae sp. ctByu2 TaxID=2827668 RepID=A0A8S5S9K0_9CAUD|nr:MAG TPA: hypothetical protein [Myoviridae sp. ctByu2]